MTLKEQIMKLQTYKMHEGENTVYVERDDVLKVLEQPSCEDAISRQAAIDIVQYECGEWKGFAKEIVKQFNGLPPVQSKMKQEYCEDTISRAETQTAIEMSASRYTLAREHEGMGQVEWSDQLIKVSDTVDIIRNLPSVKLTEQESQTFEWCTDCQEYNQEKHCCPRYNKVIRNTVEEIKELYTGTAEWVLLDECSNSGYYCSYCRKKLVKEGWSDTVKKIKYCPNCGCRMVEPQESEDKEWVR